MNIERIKIKTIDWETFDEKINNINLIKNKIDTIDELENQASIFTLSLKNIIETSTFEKLQNNQNINLPGSIKYLIKFNKTSATTICNYTHDPTVKNLANNLHNKIKKQIKQLNREKWNAVYENLTKTNLSEKKFWNALNKKTEEEVEFLQNSNKIDYEKAEILADHMEKV